MLRYGGSNLPPRIRDRIGQTVVQQGGTGASNAEQVEYQALGTGSVMRTVAAKLNEGWITPEDFGAVGGGVVDDAAPIQAALNAGSAYRVPVRLRPNTPYRVNTQLTLPANTMLEGAPGAKIIAHGDNFTSATETFSATGTVLYALSVNNVHIRGLVLEMQGMYGGGRNRWINGVVFRGVTVGSIQAEVSGLNAGNAVEIGTCSFIDIDLYAHDCLLDLSSTGQTTAIEVDDNKISSVGSVGIHIRSLRVRNWLPSVAFSTAFGNQTDGLTVSPLASVIMSHADMDGVGDGIDCQGENCNFQNFLIKNALNAGFKFIHGSNRNFVGNGQIDLVGGYGVGFFGTSNAGRGDNDRNILVGVRVSRVGQVAATWSAHRAWPDSKAAFIFDDEGRTFKVTNNQIIGCTAGEMGSADYCFRSVGTGAGNAFVNCLGEAGTLGEYQIAGSSPTVAVKQPLDGTATFGGAPIATRVMSTDTSGRITQRFDDNGNPNLITQQNAGITASGQGVVPVLARFGISNDISSLVDAGRMRVQALANFSGAGNQTAKIDFHVINAGTLTQLLSLDPVAGITARVFVSGQGWRDKVLEVGAADSAGTGFRTLRVAN